jgi:hypothetical protein
MGATRYWSVEECGWVDQPVAEAPLEADLPQQRTDEPATEPVNELPQAPVRG